MVAGALCANNQKLVCRKTDARSITTTYTYDALDRLTGKSYSNGDASVTYYYDQTSYNGLTITNGKGQRTGLSDGPGQTAWSYDTMGRMLAEERTIASITKTMPYAYNLDGSRASITYPSGRVLSYSYGNDARSVSVVDSANSINYGWLEALREFHRSAMRRTNPSPTAAGVPRASRCSR